MNEIEKRSMRRWLVGQVAGNYRFKRSNFHTTDDEWGKGYMFGKDLILTQVAVRLFGTEEALDIFNEAEKEAAY